ncbi:MAG: hypothetical protein QM698_06685 [Micropepsaceae bacterium]
MLRGLLSKIATPVANTGNQLVGSANALLEQLSPGSTHAVTTIGNITGNSGVTEDLFGNLKQFDVHSAVQSVYKDVLGPGGVVYNLADGHGLGTEALVSNLTGQGNDLLG